jgi:hypothetical protein
MARDPAPVGLRAERSTTSASNASALIKQSVQQLAHGRQLQVGFTLQPHAGTRRHLAPEAMQRGELLVLLADVGQTAACLPEADGSDGPGLGGRPGEVMGGPPDAAPILAVSTAPL